VVEGRHGDVQICRQSCRRAVGGRGWGCWARHRKYLIPRRVQCGAGSGVPTALTPYIRAGRVVAETRAELGTVAHLLLMLKQG